MDSPTLSLLPFPMVHSPRPYSQPNTCHPERSEESAFLRPLPASSSVFSVTSVLRKTRPFTDTVPAAALATRHSSLATIPFRITFFADPNPLTPIESYSYRKGGRGVGSPAPASFLPSGQVRDAEQRPQLPSFQALTSRFSVYPGEGFCTFSVRGYAHAACLRYLFPFSASPLCLNAGVLNEP
jgi:hypothetical protein